MSRFRFGPFLVSRAHRTVRREDTEVPFIPRYFDLLVVLIANRHRVVTRQEIFDSVWTDVVVSDGALSQAIRTIRRGLDDDPREPQFVRTVPRLGYQFIAADVVEETDDGPLPSTRASGLGPRAITPVAAIEVRGAVHTEKEDDPYLPLLDRLLRRGTGISATDEERREAAEQLLTLGTDEALRRLDREPGHAEARAILRDARWDVPGSAPVPILGAPAPVATMLELVRLRLSRAARQSSNRWGSAALGGSVAGAVAGIGGGIALWLVPESNAHADVVLALAVVGALAGALGAAGVGAGLAAAEVLARSQRALALAVCGAFGGVLAGAFANALTRAVVAGMFGRDLATIGGWVEGLVLGAAAGVGYAVSTSPLPGGGLATPRKGARARTAMLTGATCAVAAIALTLANRHLVGSSLDVMAQAFDGSDVGLAPLARLLGEETLRPITRTLISAGEGLLFGAGLAFGLTHRPGAGRGA